MKTIQLKLLLCINCLLFLLLTLSAIHFGHTEHYTTPLQSTTLRLQVFDVTKVPFLVNIHPEERKAYYEQSGKCGSFLGEGQRLMMSPS